MIAFARKLGVALLALGLFAAPALAQSGQIPNTTVWGNVAGARAPAAPVDQAHFTALCNQFTALLLGCVPASGGGTANFLRADGTWANPLTVGSGIISGGTTTRLLYDNAGVLGEYAIGTGLGVLGGNLNLQPASSGTIGGVNSITQTSHNWIAYIDTAGLPHQSQPACGDLSNAAASCSTDTTNASNISSGTLGAGRLPNPTASTLGGIESYAGVAHQWINTISTLGVPSSTQPTVGDLSNVNANTWLGNPTGSSAAPAANAWTSCNGNNSAVQYTNGTGTGCGTNFANLTVADQTVTGGANHTTLSQSTGNITIDCGARAVQSITNGGAFTITAPANDTAGCILIVTNNASAGAISFSGFSVGTNTGDALDTTNTHKFSIFIWRAGGTSGYRVAAHQ